LSILPLALYVTAGVAYGVHFAKRGTSSGRLATTLLMLGALAHTFVIGMQTMEVGHLPFANASSAISTSVWLLALAYLYVEITTDERAMGIFILPVMIGLQLVHVISPGVETRDPVLDSPWFWVHVASLLFAYASFALAGVLGVIYVLQFKEIKKKHLGYFYTRLPSLQTMDVMNSRAVAIGWLLLTMGVAAGMVWTVQGRVASPDDPNLQAMVLNDPKILGAALTWGVYSFALLARRTLGWTGKRAAWLSALGFVIVLLNFLPISYFVTTSHTFN
jgi:ABC-type transport system involved in cytochrome c biogenesis permease subunit